MLNEKVIQKVFCLLLESSFDYFVFRFKAAENLSEKEVEAKSKTAAEKKIVALEKF